MTRWCLAVVLAAALTPSGDGQSPPAIDVDSIGPKVSEVVPDFEAPDQHGVPRRLSALLGRNGAMLVFYRSADW